MLIAGKHPPDFITIKSAIKACVDMGEISLATQIHAFIIKGKGFSEEDLKRVYTSLVGLYWDNGELEIARNLFNRIPNRDIIAFTAMMTKCNCAGWYKEAAGIFEKMMGGDHQVTLNAYAVSSALHACSRLFDEFLGREIHAHVIKLSLESDFVVGTAVVDLYAKCGNMASAKSAFHSISHPTTAAWNAFMDGYSSDSREILRLFSRMRLTGIRPNSTNLAIVIRACKNLNLRIIQQLHGIVIKELTGTTDSFISTALFQSYLAAGCFRQARKFFDEIPEKDSIDYNLGISEYCQKGNRKEAVDLLLENFLGMNELNSRAINSLVSVSNDLNMGKQLHGLATKFGFMAKSNELLESSIMSMYLKFRRTKEAIQLFNATDSPDVVSWTSLIFGLCNNGKTREGLDLYFKRVSEGSLCYPNEYIFSCLLRACADIVAVKEGHQIHAQLIKSQSSQSDPHVLSSLLYMYAECGYISEAKRIFRSIKDPDLAIWNAMIHGMAKHSIPNEAIELFRELQAQKNLKPNHITYLGILSACNHGGLVDEGYRWFRSIDGPSVDHYSCMINMVARAGMLEEAMGLIKEMPFEPNGHIWASLLAASFIHGNAEMGRCSAEKLLELNPKDHGAYVALSNVYAAGNQWSEVKKLRKMMRKQGIRKKPGLSWLRVDQETHVFVAGKELVGSDDYQIL